MRKYVLILGGIASFLLWPLVSSQAQTAPFTPLEDLGRQLFFDSNLSAQQNQSCSGCHQPSAGFTSENSPVNAAGAVHPGSFPDRFGKRKPPSAAYAGGSPVLHYDADRQTWVGGMFWDGRATGERLGDPLAEQALEPFTNPLELALADAMAVCVIVRDATYADLFESIWGAGSLDCKHDAGGTYDRLAPALAAYERTGDLSPFTSKYDYYLAGKTTLTPQEARGLALFNGKARCATCHPSQPGPDGEPPLFTDFSYDNVGLPANPLNPFYTMPKKWNPAGAAFVDYGLGGFLKDAGYPADVYEAAWGNMKVPTLRNVDKRPDASLVKAYGHNGYFKSLDAITHFYNTRDVEAWPDPEVPANVNRDALGNLGLTPDEEAALVAFMQTLSDGYSPD